MVFQLRSKFIRVWGSIRAFIDKVGYKVRSTLGCKVGYKVWDLLERRKLCKLIYKRFSCKEKIIIKAFFTSFLDFSIFLGPSTDDEVVWDVRTSNQKPILLIIRVLYRICPQLLKNDGRNLMYPKSEYLRVRVHLI